MHESEWLPDILVKNDLVHICKVLNLSIDGFRISSLASRPVEQLRSLVRSALRSGIGKKRRMKKDPNLIPIDIFYEELSADARKERNELATDDFDMFMIALLSDEKLRPYQKLSLLYDQFHETYITYYNVLVENARSKTDLLIGVYTADENKLLSLLNNQAPLPTFEQYEAYVSQVGLKNKYDSIKQALKEKKDATLKILFVNALKDEEKFLGQLALLPAYPDLAHSVYAYYMQVYLVVQQETVATTEKDQELKMLLCEEEKKNATTQKTVSSIQQIVREAEQYKADAHATIENLKRLLKKAEEETEGNLTTIQSLSYRVTQLTHQVFELAEYQEFWETFLPRTSQARIITEHPDLRLQRLFKGMIFSKSYLLQQIKQPDEMKNKVWFVDRNHFTNTKEWMELRQLLTINEIAYEEFTDDIGLILGYATLYKDSETEE